ncbi:MAG: MFS transporter [Hyphomicrobiaceae bacterium]|nr:MFS transporter [Hyphomicrobiaceae bacterium]
MTAATSRLPSPLWLVILSAAAVAGIGMGLRQVMGLYLVPVSTDLGLGYAVFAFAVAIANLVWGFAAPVTGIVSDKYGTGYVVVFGAVATAIGILLLYAARSEAGLYLSGVFLGLGVAGAGVNAVVGAVGRAAPPEERTSAIASVGMGSGIGILIALPYTHVLIEALGWQTSLLVLAATAMLILPLAIPLSAGPAATANAAAAPPQDARAALAEAFRHPSFWLLNAGFFVCGFHVVFYGTHLPAYVASQGLGPEVAVWGLTVVGLGNLIGTWLAGQWGRRLPKRIGLSLIYAGRAVVFLGFLYLPMTAFTVIALSAALGLLWLSTIPLTSGLVATFFGPRWMTMLYGIVFLSHQIGSFLGVWLGGAIYDRLQSYDAMWWISVALGVFAALVHLPIAERPVARMAEPAAA